jgi:hypothetical protein
MTGHARGHKDAKGRTNDAIPCPHLPAILLVGQLPNVLLSFRAPVRAVVAWLIGFTVPPRK